MKLEYTNHTAELTVSIENNSSEDLSFAAGTLGYACNSVNGYMVSDGYIYEEVAAGKKTNEKAVFKLNELQAYGINSIADIELGIYTIDANYNNTYYEPKKIITSAADTYDYLADTYKRSMEDGVLESLSNCKIDYWNTDQIYSRESVSIESVALVTNHEGEQSVFIEFVNESDQMVNANISSVAVNNLVLYGGAWSSSAVNSGAKKIAEIRLNNLLDQEYQELVDVGEVSSISFDLVMQDTDDEDITTTDNIAVNISADPSSYEVSGIPLVDKNEIKLTEIGIVEDKSSYSSFSYHIIYAVENRTSDSVMAQCEYGSLSINDYMIDFYDFSGKTPSGKTGLLIVDLYEDDIEEAGISSVEDIEKIDITFRVNDKHYERLLEETVTESK
ncbi:MAG: hypothetical protein Q4B26_19855 [Eubacteriales bacterium]|nr:hypothetical protein [Eubacteriales bacterium]